MTTYKTIFLLQANLDIKEANNWYNKAQIGLGKKLVTDLTTTLKKIEQNPTSFAKRYKENRLANLKIFPFALHFVIDTEIETVFITAFLHTATDYNSQ